MTNTTDTALTILDYTPASNIVLAGALVGLREQIEAAAQANLDTVLATGEEYTETEKEAMLVIDQLRQVNGLDLTAVLLRAEYLERIERDNLIARHPGGYRTRDEMAKDQGINPAELSQTMDLARVIFPYVQDTLGIPIPVLWEAVGKTNLREVVPVMKSLITGQPSPTETVRASTDMLLDQVVASAQAAGDDIDFESEDGHGELVRRAVNTLLEDGITLTSAQLRQRIRNRNAATVIDATERIGVASIIRGNARYVLAVMNDEQYEAFRRRNANACQFDTVSLDNLTPAEREREVLRLGELRSLMDLVNNG